MSRTRGWNSQDAAQNASIAEMPQPVATVAALKALTGADNRLRYCVETETFYRYEATGAAYTADDLYVLTTGDAGNTRWLGVSGRYITDGQAVKEILVPSTGDISTAQLRNTILNNYGQSVANTQTLPTCAPGLSALIFISATGVGAFNLKAGASDKIYLDGTALDDGDKVTLAAPLVGNCATVFSVTTGAGAWDWFLNVIVGVWTDGGA